MSRQSIGTARNSQLVEERTGSFHQESGNVGLVRAIAALGAVLGFIVGRMLDKTGWGVVIGVAVGFAVGFAVDRLRQKR